MPAVPLKDRWWKPRPKFDRRDNWCTLWADQSPLTAAWDPSDASDRPVNPDSTGNSRALNDPDVMMKLRACSHCRQWDPELVQEPIHVPLQPTNRKGEVSPHSYGKMWIAHVCGTVVPIMHRRLFDAVADDLDGHILTGDVYVPGGDRIPDLLSVLDRRRVPRRQPYSKANFRHPGMDAFRPCGCCGRIDTQRQDPGYLLSSEIANRSPRVLWASLLVSPETRRKNSFEDRQQWPSLKVIEVPQIDVPADPLPSPLPTTWDDLDASLQSRGLRLPMRKLSKSDPSWNGAWNQARISRAGYDACVTGATEQKYSTMVFYVRYRALFEREVAKRIDHWSDDQLFRFVKDSHEFSRGQAPYFPV